MVKRNAQKFLPKNQVSGGRGGKRAGAGRKPDHSKDLLQTGAATAQRILDELKHEEALKKLYRTCGDTRLKAHIIFRLREWAYGKPIQFLQQQHEFDPKSELKVVIEHIGLGGAGHKASAKTK